MNRVVATVVAVIAGLWVTGSCAQTLSPYSEFQGLSQTELGALQGKLTPVGNRVRGMYTLAYAATGHTPDLSVFGPFYRSEFQRGYTTDFNRPQTFSASTQELAALIDSIGTLPGVTDGGVDIGGALSFALSVVKSGTTKVFESVLDTTNSRLLFGRMLGSLSANSSGSNAATRFACSLGLLPGPTAADVTSEVSIVARGFRKNRATGHYVGKVRVTNTGGQSIPAPIILAFRPGENIALLSRSGITCALFPPGAPFQTLPVVGSLAPGQHVDATLQFDDPDGVPIELFSHRVYAGPGFR